jgi:hypothetical protein
MFCSLPSLWIACLIARVLVGKFEGYTSPACSLNVGDIVEKLFKDQDDSHSLANINVVGLHIFYELIPLN